MLARAATDTISAAEGAYAVRMQFLNITNERVQDLLQTNCHAHDLQLTERAQTGCAAIDSVGEAVLLRGEVGTWLGEA